MKRVLLLSFLLAPMVMQATCRKPRTVLSHKVDTVAMNAIVQRYAPMLTRLVQESTTDSNKVNILSTYRLFTPATLYRAPLRDTFKINWAPSLPGRTQHLPRLTQGYAAENNLRREQNAQFMRLYVQRPQLVKLTEHAIDNAGDIRKEELPHVPQKVTISEDKMAVDLSSEVGDIELKVKRPNFWKFRGDYSLQFTQSHFSDNWYQGGEDNYTLLALATMEANFNNKQKIQWDNKLEMRLGFQTSKNDEKHKYKTNDDLLRLTTKLGYRATKRWFYTAQVQAYTQFYPSYQNNSDKVKSDFMSPFNLVVSVGMDYKLELKRFKGSAYIAPVAYNYRSVDRRELFGQFGLDPGHCTYNNFGPNITVNYTWDIWKNIRWQSRIYWFSNLEMTDIEWENTFTFSINKYLNTRLFIYPRVDDSSPKYYNEKKESYFMFKEWLSLGVNYSF